MFHQNCPIFQRFIFTFYKANINVVCKRETCEHCSCWWISKHLEDLSPRTFSEDLFGYKHPKTIPIKSNCVWVFFLTKKYHLDFSKKEIFGKRCYQNTKGNIEEPDAWLRVSAMVDPLLGWRGSGWWPGGFLVCSAPSGGRQSGHHHSSAQVGRGGTARRPLAVLSLLIAASRMARYQVTKMSTSAVQIADRFLCGGDHLWQAVHGVKMKLQGNPHLDLLWNQGTRVLVHAYIVSWNEVK